MTNVELIYLDIGALGRGEVVRLYLNAVEVPFKDTRIPMDQWPAKKQELLSTGINPSAKVPVLLIDGRPYTEHISILRYVARTLGLYGKDVERDFYADAVADSYQEWRNEWAQKALGSDEEAKTKFYAEAVPLYLKRFETFLEKYPEGPFVTGKDFTFADAALFQIVHNTEKTGGASLRTAEYPLITKLYAAVEALPSASAYLKSRQD